jgi:hypothetical protein
MLQNHTMKRHKGSGKNRLSVSHTVVILVMHPVCLCSQVVVNKCRTAEDRNTVFLRNVRKSPNKLLGFLTDKTVVAVQNLLAFLPLALIGA